MLDVVTISGYHDVPQNNELSLLKALANQPLSVAIEASSRDFQFYSGVSLLWTQQHIYLQWIIIHICLEIYIYQSPNSNINDIDESVGYFWWPLWNWARSWCGCGWIWDIKGFGLHHCEEFMGTEMGRERLYKDEEKQWQAWRDMWNLQNGFLSY